MTPIVVYHAAGMGHWPEVVREQFKLLADAGLPEVRLTHVGAGLDAILAEAARHGVAATLVRTDPNVMHYETFAMLEIERLAKEERVDRPVLYLHTKGVSAPHDPTKTHWRRVMQHYVVVPWRDNVRLLETHDAAGVNWLYDRHFSGTFWIARADWIRRLPDFADYHGRNGLTRYTCENWIGSAPGIRPASLGVCGVEWWAGGPGAAQWAALKESP